MALSGFNCADCGRRLRDDESNCSKCGFSVSRSESQGLSLAIQKMVDDMMKRLNKLSEELRALATCIRVSREPIVYYRRGYTRFFIWRFYR
jgi:transcription initiation factor IIE alpha subunit